MTLTATHESSSARKKAINPWQWQDSFGYSQAIEVSNVTKTLYCAGQAAMDENGIPSTGGMDTQLQQSLQNLEVVLQKGGYTLSDVTRLTYYTTSINDFFNAYGNIAAQLAEKNSKPAATVVEVRALAFPSLLVEIEATAVK